MIGLRRITNDQRGFTLVELLTAMVVFGLLLGSFSMVMSSTIRHTGEVEQQGNLQLESRTAITTIAQDLRQTYDGDNDVATSPILGMSANQVTVYSPDRRVPFHLRKVTYRLNAGRLERATLTSTDTDGSPWVGISGTPSAWQVVVRNVVNTGAQPLFVYRDADGVVTANALLVQTVDVSIIVATRSSPSRKYTYESSVTVRGEA